MARWYARFDSGSNGWTSALDNTNGAEGYFSRLRIGANSASGALLRDGLIASRSALSSDVYEDLDPVNQDGGKGTYFPPDSGPFSSNYSTFASWSSAYTSSIQGIVIPSSNTYGVADSINYSKRPTGSVSSSTAGVVVANPIDPVGVSYTTYFSASQAVRTVVADNIQTGNGTLTTPFTRVGNDASRTQYSLWHDPDLQYFAWDDFTPGAIAGKVTHSIGPNSPLGCPVSMSLGDPVSIDLEIYVDVAQFSPFLYPNDGNYSAEIGFTVELRESGSGGTILSKLQLGGPQDNTPYLHGGPILIGDYSTGNGPVGNRNTAVSSSWQWNLSGPNYNGQLKWTIPVTAGQYALSTYVIIHDVIVTTNTVQASCFNFPGPATNCGNYAEFLITAGTSL